MFDTDPMRMVLQTRQLHLNRDGTWTSYFGYENDNTSAISVPAGSTNFFSPAPMFVGQPTTFMPGIQHNVFSVTEPATVSVVTWHLDGIAANAYAPESIQLSAVQNLTTGQTITISGITSSATQVYLSATIGTLSAASVTSDANGNFSVTYTAPATAGPGAVTAETSSGSINTVAFSISTPTAPVVATTISLSPSSSTVAPDGTVTVTGTVYNGESVVPGLAVNLTSTAGTLSQATLTTDANGQFTATLTAPSVQEGVAVLAKIPGTEVSAAVGIAVVVTSHPMVPVATNLSISALPPEVQADGTVTLTGIAYNGSAPAANVPVHLMVTDGSVNSPAVTTDNSGHFTAVFTAPSTAEGVAVLAFVPSTPAAGVAMVTVTALSRPFSVKLTISQRTLKVGHTATLSGIVTSGGTGVPNASVQFTATAGNVSPQTVTTDANGHFEATFTAPNAPGRVAIEATVAGTSKSRVVAATVTKTTQPNKHDDEH